MDSRSIIWSADIVPALGRIADAVAGGEITPDEGAAVAAVLEGLISKLGEVRSESIGPPDPLRYGARTCVCPRPPNRSNTFAGRVTAGRKSSLAPAVP